MASALRLSWRAVRIQAAVPRSSAPYRRHASSDYGSTQSGHEQGIHQKNPKKHLEHPGPEPPKTTGQQGQQSHSPESQASTSEGKPTIQQPSSANEDKDEEVRKHNEEMRNRSEKTANQLGEEDNKVDKKFWSGDVGEPKKNG